MKSSELQELTLLSAVKSIRDGEITSVELTESLLKRIEATESAIKAYTTVCREESISMAEEADRKLRSGSDKIGLLHGIPVTVKDLIKTKGIRTTAGSRILAQNIPSIDATVVRLLKNAGAFVLGKSNTHEFALGGMTPPTKNPWDFDVVPGGSSGGSAASIAASSAIAALGSDTGGSIRIPASYCGVVGLKPTYGRVSRFGVYPESWSLDHLGPITKTVEDCALLMNVISGYDSSDPNSAPAGVPDFIASIDKSISGVKVGVPRNYFFDHLHEEVLDCVQDSIQKLERDYDAVVVPFDFPNIDLIMAAYTAIDSSEVSSYHEENYLKRKELYQPDVRSYMELGFLITATQYLKAQRMRSMLSNAVEAVFSKFDVIITPTQPMTAPRPDSIVSEFPGGFRESTLFSMARLTAPFNLTGHPTLTINCGFSKKTPNPLPIGLQITGRLFDEGTILRVGNAFEKVVNLRNRHPIL